ncbi:hypothetical protein D3C86_1427830 [compost metagenome]
MDVDDAGRDVAAAGVDHLVAARDRSVGAADGGDAAVGDHHHAAFDLLTGAGQDRGPDQGQVFTRQTAIGRGIGVRIGPAVQAGGHGAVLGCGRGRGRLGPGLGVAGRGAGRQGQGAERAGEDSEAWAPQTVKQHGRDPLAPAHSGQTMGRHTKEVQPRRKGEMSVTGQAVADLGLAQALDVDHLEP